MYSFWNGLKEEGRNEGWRVVLLLPAFMPVRISLIHKYMCSYHLSSSPSYISVCRSFLLFAAATLRCLVAVIYNIS